MCYVPRGIAAEFRACLRQFPAVLLLGPRQAGKTCFLKQALKDWTAVDLDDQGTLLRVQEDPRLFLSVRSDRIWFDEAQRAPELFSALRVAIDKDRRPGRFVLSGSASPFLLRRAQETLAGRMGILRLEPFSFAELRRARPPALLGRMLSAASARDLLRSLDAARGPKNSPKALREYWLWGGFPEPALLREDRARIRWFSSYLQTYLERDLLRQVPRLNILGTRKLLLALAYRHGQILSLSDLARDLDVAPNTVKSQLDILEASLNWYRLPPYHANLTKRLVKSPKGYFLDTGLLHSLLNLTTPQSLEVHPLMGASWESMILHQIRSALRQQGEPARLYYWRTQAGAEVDLVLEHEGRLLPVEIKRASAVARRQLLGIRSFLDDFRRQAPFGVVLYPGERPELAEERVALVPTNRLFPCQAAPNP